MKSNENHWKKTKKGNENPLKKQWKVYNENPWQKNEKKMFKKMKNFEKKTKPNDKPWKITFKKMGKKQWKVMKISEKKKHWKKSMTKRWRNSEK